MRDRDFPLWKPRDKIWTVRFKEATCRGISHFGKSGVENSGVLVMRDRDFPLWKPRDKIWTVRFKGATCREISHFGKSGIANLGVLVTRDRDFPWWKPRDRSGPSDLRRLRAERLTASGNRGSRIRESRGREFGLS
jgi:hypothetical protein